MPDPLPKNIPEQNKKILWGSFVLAIFVYNLVAWRITATNQGFGGYVVFSKATINNIFYAFLAISIIIFFLLLRLREKFQQITSDPVKPSGKNIFITMIALPEEAAILGLEIFFFSGDLWRLWILSGISFLLLILVYPRTTR